MQNLRTFLLVTALANVIAACGGSSSGDNINPAPNYGNACGASAVQSASTLVANAVPPGGAGITTARTFPDLTFSLPVGLLQAPNDDRCWYVVEKAGRALSFENISNAESTSAFIDISATVDSEPNEAGLLGMAFHPDYTNNGEVFLSYTTDDSGLKSVVSRFRSLDGGATLDPTTEEVLLSLSQPFGNHNGGHISFGPDGYLYIGFGDGGSGNDPGSRAQNTLNLFGALLRIDVDGSTPYAIPADNPFAGNALCAQGEGAASCPEIFAYGLRNPWRWSFDSASGDLWLGDVGQNAIEEINLINNGGNYGWPYYEGTRCNDRAPVVDCNFVGIPPLSEYGRDDGRSVTGGYVYRGNDIPDLVGAYVYADFVSGNLFQYANENGSVVESITPTAMRISSFGQSSSGELYLVDYAAGELHKIIAAP